ncbi:MAG: energy-coupling factor ABC transporter ATP-binding protein [Synechococcaceae cyanobacterium SM2_3_60]|nr:energy-coupling factor ABC transporter ATP-binding protein [Synechococcaceae cyanobacterium SM2_3_60]
MLRVQNLSVHYPNGHLALQGVSFAVAAGERVGVVGVNGAGKTTCFLSICGVVPASQGQIVLNERPVKPRQFRPEVGLIMQNPDDQLFAATVAEDVAFGPTNMGCTDVPQRVERALEAVGLGAVAERSPHQLSGGQKRMIAIATVLAMQPQLLLCDEPSANLDSRSRRRLINCLRDLPQAMLIAAHDLEFILELCERVLLFDAGQVVADGATRHILADPALMTAHGLEVPYSLA